MSLFLVLLSILVVLFIVIGTGVCLLTRYKNILLGVCVVFVAIGCFIYTICYLSFGESFANPLFAALRGIFSTARMFIMSDDYAAVMSIQGAAWLTENIWMQILFWLSHLSALILVQAALLSLFGRGIFDEFRLRFGPHREVYIIKGSDKNALMLGENIATHDDPQQNPDPKRLVIFLLGENVNAKKVSEKISHFGGIVQVLNRNHDFLYCLKKARLGKRGTLEKIFGEKKYHIILTSDNVSTPNDAHRIATFAKEKGVNRENVDIFVFASTDWERKKIEEITQAKKDGQRQYPYTFHIVNEVDLVIRKMIEKHPPVECPGLHFLNGVAARDFIVMILGFGTVGQAALLHLIMNGQFVGSQMRAIIIDKNIEEVRDSFQRRYRSLDLCCKMEFIGSDVQCDDFVELLNTYSNVDYVVITLNHDQINQQIALDIQSHYEVEGINAVPFIAVSEKNGSLYEAENGGRIFTFGYREEIYTESVIIREEANIMAKAVHEVYGGEPPWHELNWFTQESNRAVADFIPAMLKLANIEKEDVLNKVVLTEDSTLAENLAETEKIRWNAFHAVMGYRSISIEEMQQRFNQYDGERNSPQHLAYARKDSDLRLHVCIAPWGEMDEISQAYQELARCAGVTKEQERNFKDTDREIVKYIPKFLKEAESRKQ